MKTCLVVAGAVFHENRLLLIKHKKLGLWLPVGGHIEKDETPDDALRREVMEETGLEIEILNGTALPLEGNKKHNLKLPFHADVHSVIDHDHCCFYYICRALNHEVLAINRKELDDIAWFSRAELQGREVPADVRNVGLLAFEMLGRLPQHK